MSSMRDYGKQCRLKHASERRAYLNKLALRDVFVELLVITACLVVMRFFAYKMFI